MAAEKTESTNVWKPAWMVIVVIDLKRPEVRLEHCRPDEGTSQHQRR